MMDIEALKKTLEYLEYIKGKGYTLDDAIKGCKNAIKDAANG